MHFERYDDALRDEEAKTHPNYKYWTPDDTCAICGAPLEDRADLGDETKDVEALIEKLTCGHVFHRTCLQESIKAGVRNCPLADQTPIAQEVLNRLAPGTNAREGEGQRLGNRDPNAQIDYDSAEAITTGNDGRPIAPEDEEVYNAFDEEAEDDDDDDDDDNDVDYRFEDAIRRADERAQELFYEEDRQWPTFYI